MLSFTGSKKFSAKNMFKSTPIRLYFPLAFSGTEGRKEEETSTPKDNDYDTDLEIEGKK